MKLLIMADASSVHTERWCRYFEDAGVETGLYSLEPCSITPPKHLFQGKRPTSQGIIDYYLARNHFQSILNEFKPDIVNAHYIISYGWLATTCNLCPVVATAWGSDLLLLPQKSFVHRQRIDKALNHAEYCTVDNRNLHDAAAKFISPDKIIEVIMGVNRQNFERIEKADFTLEGEIRIIAPRGLAKVYDPETIVAGVEKNKGQLDLHIDLLGRGSETDRIQSMIDKASLVNIITMRPFVGHDVYIDGLKNYDLYLSASRSDSTSVALLEAMAAGLIPVVSDIAGNREWITEGENGFLFETGSAVSLALSLERAFASRRNFSKMAKVNRTLIKEKAIWQDNMDRLKTLFERLVG